MHFDHSFFRSFISGSYLKPLIISDKLHKAVRWSGWWIKRRSEEWSTSAKDCGQSFEIIQPETSSARSGN